MKMYMYPSKDEVAKWGGMGVFMGYFFDWNIRKNIEIIEDLGWERREGRIEISYTDHEKLDCLSMNLHDYLKFLKYGYGRATDSACIDIRNGVIDREEGVRLAERYDGKYPKECVERFSEHFNITKEEFSGLCEEFTNRALFERKNGKLKYDIDGSLVMEQKYMELRRNPCNKINEIITTRNKDEQSQLLQRP